MTFTTTLNPIITRLVSLLFKLGDKGQSQAFEQVTAVLEREYQSNKQDVLEAFKIVILQVPFKISSYVTLTGLLNAKNEQIAQDLAQMAFEQMSLGFQEHDFLRVKLIMRYLADLMNVHVVNPSEFMSLLETLSLVLYDPSVSASKSDAYTYMILLVLPWAGKILSNECGHDFIKLTSNISTHIKSRRENKDRQGIDKALQCTSVYRSSATPMEGHGEGYYNSIEIIEILSLQVTSLEAQNYKNSILSTPYQMFESLFSGTNYATLPSYTLPMDLYDVKFCYQAKLWIFDDSISDKIAQVPKMHSIERFILDDMIHDMIRIYSLNHKECTRLLLSLSVYIQPAFAERFNIYQSIVEILFSEMLRFPKPTEKSVYYTTLLMELCKGALDRVPSAMGRALKILFDRLEGPTASMDIESIRRLSEWFAHHLSNFGYAWKWNEWSSILHESPDSLKKIFIKETLLKCVRLSYYERIRNSLPEEYYSNGTDSVFLPSEHVLQFKYGESSMDSESTVSKLASKMNLLISKRADKETVSSLLSEMSALPSSELDSMELTDSHPSDLGKSVFLQVLFYNGSKSFSHLLSLVEKYLLILMELNTSFEQKMNTIQVAFEFWHQNTQFFEITLDKFMNYRILDPHSIISWTLSAPVLNEHYSHFYIWSILKMTINKVLLKVEQLKVKLQNAKNMATGMRVDTPTLQEDDEPESVSALESLLESANRESKETFILVLQRFILVLTERLSMDANAFNTPWWKWVSESMREIARAFQKQLMPLKVTIEAILFSDDSVHPMIMEIWQEMKAMDEYHDSDFI